METTPIDQSANDLATAAHLNARAGFELFGRQLYPYAPSRKRAANAMGLKYGFIPEHRVNEFGGYDGEMGDVINVMWLCTLKNFSELTREDYSEKLWTVQKAERRPDEACEAATAWGDPLGLTDTASDHYSAARVVFFAIMRGEAASTFAVEVDGSRNPPDTPDPNDSARHDGPTTAPVSPA